MKRLLVLTFLICFFFSSVSVANQNTNFDSRYVVTLNANNFPNIFRSIGNLFKRLTGKKRRSANWGDAQFGVKNVTLSRTELTTFCGTDKTNSDNPLTIEVTSESLTPDPELVTDFIYTVTGGNIIKNFPSNIETRGQKAKVIWDLSDVKPGTYTITVEVNNRCPSCGPIITKEVKVLNCLKNARLWDT
jgi:hypothetical protein